MLIFLFHFLEPLIFLLYKSQSDILYYPIFPLLQEEGAEPYLETYYSENEGEDGGDSSTCNLQSETNFPYDFQNLEPETKSEVPEPHEYAVANSLGIEAYNVEEDNSLPRLSQ